MERSQGRRGPLKGFTRRLSGIFLPGRAAEEIERRESQRREAKSKHRLIETRQPDLSVVRHVHSKRGVTKKPYRKTKARAASKRAKLARRENRAK